MPHLHRSEATASAHPNLALVKYWGYADPALNLPANNSISITLSGATTTTTVIFDASMHDDVFVLNGVPGREAASRRVSAHLDRVRELAGSALRAHVSSHSDVPVGLGMASSAAAFAALSLAATRALHLDLPPRELSILARKGSGSACRSVFGGYVEWDQGHDDASSFARPIYAPDHWDLRVVSVAFPGPPKRVSSQEGHRAAPRSPLYAARLREVEGTLHRVRESLRHRDLATLGMAVEREALSLHAIAMTSPPEEHSWMSGIVYMEPETVRLIHAVQEWRAQGAPVYFTLDAGPTVHLLCEPAYLDALLDSVRTLFSLEMPQLWISGPGQGTWVVTGSHVA
jgi:diphosphomevalonate decarboxylase